MARSTPLRLTRTLVAIFTLFTLAGFCAAYLITRESAEAEISADLQQVLEAVRNAGDQGAVEERVAELVASNRPADLLIRYAVPGKPVLGSLPAAVAVEPGQMVGRRQLSAIQGKLADSYLGWRGSVHGGELTLLVGRDGLEDLGGTFGLILLWSLIPALVLATIAGGLVARRARDRLDAIEHTLALLTSGNHGARVPVGRKPPDDLGQIAAAVNRMAEAQEASRDSLRQISTDIAHDLKTPIQRVAVLLEKLDNGTLDGVSRSTVVAARAETARIIQTFQSLLQIAQLESGQARADFAPVNLSALARDMQEIYEPSALDSGHSLTVAATDEVWVQGERNLLGRLIANLIENAMRHAPPGPVSLKVMAEDSVPTLTVRDHGPGIPDSERSKVMGRLYRLERSRTTEGSGLGLSLVSAIAELHGARVRLGDAAPGLEVRVEFEPASPAGSR